MWGFICIVNFESKILITYVNKGIGIFSFFSKASFSQSSIDLTEASHLDALLISQPSDELRIYIDRCVMIVLSVV